MSLSVMRAQLNYKDSILSSPVNKTVFVVDAPGPITGEAILKRFEVAGLRERIATRRIFSFTSPFQSIIITENSIRTDKREFSL